MYALCVSIGPLISQYLTKHGTNIKMNIISFRFIHSSSDWKGRQREYTYRHQEVLFLAGPKGPAKSVRLVNPDARILILLS